MKTQHPERRNPQAEQLRATYVRRRHGLPEPIARLVAALHYGEASE